MFDLWGEKTPLPMPSLDLETADVSNKEKARWEKDLMGVSFSEKPFSPAPGGSETAFCGQIDAELEGQTIVVAGRVITVRYLFTREKKPFVSAVLEDFSGQVEVMVWPRVYAETGDLWQEDNELLIKAKVKLREDRVQVSCDEVRSYQPPVPGEEITVPPPAEIPLVEKAAPSTPPAEKPAAVEKPAPGAPPARKPAPAKETVTTAPAAENRRLVISLSQTSDEERDKTNLHKLKDALKDFPGPDEVKLRIINGEKIRNLRFFDIYTNYCPELHQRLIELVGEEGIRLESY
jgi:DNA polymerase-3 subunit alpha